MKYRKSKLGGLWSILMPVGLSVIIGGVYSIIFSNDPRVFIPMIFAGLNPWQFISGCAEGGTSAFINAEGYLKQTSVNAQIFPLRIVLGSFINLLYALIAFFAIYLFLRPEVFGPRMLMVFPGLAIVFVFCWGIANIAATVNLNVRDYQPMQSLILQGLFYVTPIIYPASTLAEKGFGFVYQVNPCYYMLEIIKAPIQGVALPDMKVYGISIAIAVCVFLFSIWIVMREKKGIAFKL